MARIAVTGATGHLGNLVIANLLKRGVQPQDIRASVRDVARADHHQKMGIEVRRGDFDDPQACRDAFSGIERLLIISSDKVGSRVEQHGRAVQAAREAGVQHIIYTSIVDMLDGESTNALVPEHRATEQLIRESGVSYTILRNSVYAEYLIDPVVRALEDGVFVSSAGDSKFGGAARTDMAEAAAVVLSEPGHENKIYELTYPRPWDYRELVDIVSKVSGRPFTYRPVSDEEMVQILRQVGIPDEAVQMAVGMNRTLREGHWSKTTGDLEQLLGHPVTSLEELVRRSLSG